MVRVYRWGCLEREYHVLAEQVDTAALLHSSLKVLLTGMCHTGFPSTDSRQSHRVHPAHEAKKPYPPARHRWLKEAECPVGAAGWVDDEEVFVLVCESGIQSCITLFSLCCSSRIRESQGEQSAPDKLLFWQQPVHEPQRQRGVRLWWRVGLQLRIRARRAAQQKEAARGAQLDLAAPGSPNRLHFFCLFSAHQTLTGPSCLHSVVPYDSSPGVKLKTVWQRLCHVLKHLYCHFSLPASITALLSWPSGNPQRQAALQFWRILCFSNVMITIHSQMWRWQGIML